MRAFDRFRGKTRQIDVESLSTVPQAFFRFGMPWFSYEPTDVRSALHADEQILNRDRQLKMARRLPRRFAGDVLGHINGVGPADLPRKRYQSLITRDGTDRGVLRNEMLAYSRFDQCFFSLIDGLRPQEAESVGLAQTSDAIFAVLAGPEVVGPFQRHLTQLRLAASGRDVIHNQRGWLLLRFPCVTADVDIQNCMDLRKPSDRASFFETFRDGVPRLIQWPRKDIRRFEEMLPFLMNQGVGGGPILEAIGAFLRLEGIGGLIYPSARSDIAVRMRDGSIDDFMGFNLVQYKDAAYPKRLELQGIATDSPWNYPLPYSEVTIQVADDGDARGSFLLTGILAASNRNRSERGFYFDIDPHSLSALDVLFFDV